MTNEKPLVTIVGVGALGSHVAMLLRNEARLRLIDYDRVEAKNTLSQFHNKASVGKLKAAALSSSLQMNWGMKSEHLIHRLDNSNINVMLKGSTLVIDCVDNITARKTLKSWCTLQAPGKTTISPPLLHGALAADGQFGRAIWSEYFTPDGVGGEGGATCEDGAHLPFIAITAGWIARAAQIFLRTGNKVGFSITPVGVIPT
jgi:molybdopterin/thiamine biosynthesis adenylyltransferase